MTLGILWLALLIVILAGGFFAALLNFFGAWIIFGGALFYAWVTEFQILQPKTLLILGALALAGEAVDFIFTHLGIRKMGGGKGAVAGAFVGGFAGAALGAIFLGTGVVLGGLLGIFFGAFVGELIKSGDWRKAFKVGAGGLIGVAGSLITKILIALVMIEMIVSRVFSSGI